MGEGDGATGALISDDEQFRRMVGDFAEGKVEVILMHIDTTKLLSAEEWERLQAAGAAVIAVHKKVPDQEG